MSDPAEPTPHELVDAIGVFLAPHVAALDDAAVEVAPERARDAVEGLLETVGKTLPRFVGEPDVALGRAMPPSEDDAQTPAWVRAVARRRLDEAEGALLHLRLALASASPTPDARVRHENCLKVAREALAAVEATLRLWAQVPRAPVRAREALRLARQCLVVGAPAAAAPLLRTALLGALAEPHPMGGAHPADLDAAWAAWDDAARPPDVPREATEEAWRATFDDPADALRMWAALDVAERLVNIASMTPLPQSKHDSALRGS